MYDSVGVSSNMNPVHIFESKSYLNDHDIWVHNIFDYFIEYFIILKLMAERK